MKSFLKLWFCLGVFCVSSSDVFAMKKMMILMYHAIMIQRTNAT